MPADVSFLHFLFYVASAGKFDLPLDTEGGAQQDRFVEGRARSPQGVAEGAQRLADPVGARAAHRVDARGRRVHGDGVGSGAARDRRGAPTLAGRIWVRPAAAGLPGPAHTAGPDGRGDQVLAVYDEPFWRSEGLSGARSASRAR